MQYRDNAQAKLEEDTHSGCKRIRSKEMVQMFCLKLRKHFLIEVFLLMGVRTLEKFTNFLNML